MSTFEKAKIAQSTSAAELDWADVYEELLPSVYHYFCLRSGDRLEAEDLTAATFERAWRDRGRYRKDLGTFTNWLFVIPQSGGARPYAPPGMHKEVRVNGQPAILVLGRLAPNSPENPHAQRVWNKTLGFQLTWSGKHYIYSYPVETLGPYVSEHDLIRMAESMKKAPAPLETTAPRLDSPQALILTQPDHQARQS